MRSAVAVCVLATAAHASPDVPLDDPVYDELARLDALGELGPYQGGVAPLTEDRVRELLHRPALAGWWARPLERVTARASAFSEDDRPYSTPARPRDLAGFVALSCEHQEGRPCGDGEGFLGELDASAGYGALASAAVRLRATTGTELYGDALAVDRAYATANLGPATIVLGRDVLALGPRARTQLAWGDSAPALDQLRVQTARPYPLGDELRGSLLYVVGRLRDPAQAHPPLVSIARAQLDVASRVEIGLHQELALGGDGAPSLGAWDFISEQVRRADASASASDSSNRRFGGDVAVHLPGARLYYALVFEDIRAHVLDAVAYDADHLLGVELAALAGKHGLVVEVARTGARSYEHVPQRTEFANDGRVVGDPLGPAATSIYAGGRIELDGATLLPWLELARLASDSYTFVAGGPIVRATTGPTELRYRTGARARLPITRELRGEVQASYEHVSTLAFDPSAHRDNLGMMLVLVWQPAGFWSR